jgi:hypothetical protein
MARREHNYSSEEKAAALAAATLAIRKDTGMPNWRQVEKHTGISRRTLADWWANRCIHPDANRLAAEKKGDLADKLEQIAHEIIGILPSKYENSTLMQATTSLAIAVDKMQLLRGQPTNINKDLTDEQIDTELNEIAEAARRRAENEQRGTSNTG